MQRLTTRLRGNGGVQLGGRSALMNHRSTAALTSRSNAALATTPLRKKSARTTKSWVPTEGDQLEKAITNSLLHTLSNDHTSVSESVVPWFLKSLPESYFNEVGEETRLAHLRGLVALRGFGQPQHDFQLVLKSRGDDPGVSEVTVMSTDCRPGTLHSMIQSMQRESQGGTLDHVRALGSVDGQLTLNIFTYRKKDSTPSAATEEDGALILDAARHYNGPNKELFTREALIEYFRLCSAKYVANTSIERFFINRQLYEQVRGTEDVAVRIDPMCPDSEQSERVRGAWISIATAPVSTKPLRMLSVTGLLSAKGIDVLRMRFDTVRDPSNDSEDRAGQISLMRFLVVPTQQGPNVFKGTIDDLDSPHWHTLKQETLRACWVDKTTMDLALDKSPSLGMQRAEILAAFCALLHGPLSKLSPFAFSKENLLLVVGNPLYAHYASDVADLFLARFDPSQPLSADVFRQRASVLRERIQVLANETARILLLKMVDTVELTLRTNLHFPNRQGLALRVDPSLMVTEKQAKPFGIFFVHGSDFNGFHNRFQNIARGGLRLVTPSSAEQLAVEASRQYDEVYGLSQAQELKNKDIPEGGAKAVVLVDCADDSSETNKYLKMRGAVKSFTNGILDLTVPSEETRKYMVDYLGTDELIYLGPDEQVIPEDINWIIKQAGKRGYPIPGAFMSSKPLAGINHKEFGVTSEGVVVFLDVALRSNGIQPDKQPFTVKITGGPDGDVAGNLMRILFRDYGENARIVGVADGSGCAEDPNGLPHDELMRLFHCALPIADIDASKLSPEGVLHRVGTEEGVRMRNSMHMRVKSDVFVPAGGRPSTIHAGNWDQFLDPTNGEPSSPLIVEGANIFITPEARQNLYDKARVKVVKDSSANKCGVITSSYEICASMLLDENEFLEIKEEVVQDVLERLRELASLEAQLMFREFQNYPGALPDFSQRISQCIIRASYAIRQSLANVQRGDEMYIKLMPLFLENLPRKLAEVAADRIDERIPIDYLRNAFAKNLASKLLYREGINFIESLPEENLAEFAIRYIEEEKRIQELIGRVDEVSFEDSAKQDVLQLLRRGGVRSSLQM